MAIAAIFQTDLDLRNAQPSRVLAWLKQEHPSAYPEARTLNETTNDDRLFHP